MFYDLPLNRRFSMTFYTPPDDDPKGDEDKTPKGGGKDDDDDEGNSALEAQVKKWRDLARKNERTAKENADAAKKLEELESANKSEIDKAKDAQTKAEENARGLERELTRLRVAIRKGLSETQARRLVGENEEELEADADELLETFKPASDDGGKQSSNGNSSKPKENLKPGTAPKEEPQETDPAKLADLVPRGTFSFSK